LNPLRHTQDDLLEKQWITIGQHFFKVLDGVEVQFGDYFDQDSLNVLQKVERGGVG
jgi:hypothetical protein